ncbi:MAG: hypothetical protein APR62_02760 [Smithella sp. SDB]|nr:MAG: hypothetical protein APR62_02760 [Smithella sp. SDB]
MKKIKWASARLIFVTAAIGVAFTGGILGYFLYPLYSWYFFNDIKLRYHKYLPRLISAFWNQVCELLRNPDYRAMFLIPWTMPPMNGPDLSLVRTGSTWPDNDRGCGNCVNCCLKRNCPLHDIKRNRCRSYGSFFWRYFNCGRYPQNAKQIQFYDCKKWEIFNCLNEND